MKISLIMFNLMKMIFFNISTELASSKTLPSILLPNNKPKYLENAIDKILN